ncbi:MAG: Do family serine endopeptidase [Rhodomicrobium sp.]
MASGRIQDETGRAARRFRPAGVIAGAGLLGASILAAIPGGAVFAPSAAAAQDFRGPNMPASFADLADKVRPAVVSVNVKSRSPVGDVSNRDLPVPDLPPDSPLREFFDQFKHSQPERRPTRAQGSGFLISADGYVVTNHHVADKADEIEITFENEEKYKATIVGSDSRTDIALLKIDTKKKFNSYLEFADTAPRVGDWVLAVGNPFGLGGTVTAGIVSASGRDIGSGPYDFLQIDAAVNRGNSGGPAVDLNGRVIGVNTAIYSPSGGSVGIAFAIPASTARDVVTKLKEKGKVSSGWLGVQIQNVDENIAESQGLKDAKGALVAKILPEGPAAKSELKARDIIEEVNGKPVANSRELARTIAALAPGSDARLRVFRNGDERELTIKLGEFPNNEKVAALTQGNNDESEAGKELEDLGLTLVPAPELHGSKVKEGVAVSAVDPNSKAAEQGLKRGDIIVEVNGKTVATADDVVDSIREARVKGRKAVLLQIKSRDQQRFLALPIESKDDEKDQGGKDKAEPAPDKDAGKPGKH